MIRGLSSPASGQRAARCFLLTLALAALTAAYSCGASGGLGGGLTTQRANSERPWPGHNFETGVSKSGFTVVAVDHTDRNVDRRMTGQLELEVLTHPNGAADLRILGRGLTPTNQVYLHLQYDRSLTHPAATALGSGLADSTLFIGLTEAPGIVSLGLATIGGVESLSGDIELATLSFSGGAVQATRRASTVTGSVVSDLHFDSESPGTLVWSYRCQGDYNQDGTVLATDLGQIGLYFLANTDSPTWPAAQTADGNEDGKILATDLGPIGLNFLFKCSQYQIMGGAASDGPFAQTGTESTLNGALPVGGGFRVFRHTLSAPVDGGWYVVAAGDGAQFSTSVSNAVQYSSGGGGTGAPQNLATASNGTNIVLHWDPPASGAPDNYAVYVASDAALAGALPLDLSTNGPDYIVSNALFPPTNEYYFGVKANYGAEQSGYSNIAHYSPAGPVGPPTNLTAVKNVDHIDLSWSAPFGGGQTGYDAYIGSDAELSDAFKLNGGTPVPGELYSVPALFSPDTPHYFGVKALSPTGESEFSNIFHYDPSSENDPPVWDAASDIGIKSAAPFDGQVAIEWFAATDSESPPVTYLIYYAPSATGIDWSGAAQDTATASELQKSVTGLTNGTSYDFGVRAQDALGNRTTNTNFLAATPTAGGTPVDSGVWGEPELVDDGGILSKQEVGRLPSVAVASDGTVHIAHYNFSSKDLLYTYGGSGDWHTSTVTSEGDTGLWPDIEIDPQTGLPCIAYHNAEAFSLEYAQYDGSDWAVETVDTGSDLGAFASLEFDPDDDEPAIAYWNTAGQDVKYAKWTGSAWQKTTVYNGQGAAQLNGAYSSLGFSPTTGDPAISFLRNTGDLDYSLMVAVYDGSSWDLEIAELGPFSDIGINTAGLFTSLCFSPAGHIYVSHIELLGEFLITENSAGAWTTSSVDTGTTTVDLDRVESSICWANGNIQWVFYESQSGSVHYGSGFIPDSPIESGSTGQYPFITSDADGNLHAAYFNQGQGRLRYATKPAAGAWAAETAEGGTGGMASVGERASLQFHPGNGSPMVSYYDTSNGTLKFARKNGELWESEVVSANANDGSASGLVVKPNGSAVIGFFGIASNVAGLYTASGSFGDWDIATIQEADFTVGGDVVGNYCSVGIGAAPAFQVGVSYYNATQKRIETALDDGSGGWEQTPVDIFGDAGRWSSTAFNPANKLPGVAYHARDAGDLWFAERNTGGLWTPVTVDAGGTVGNHCSLCYGSNTAAPWISYYDTTNKKLKVAYLSTPPGPMWRNFTISAPSGSADYGNWSSIAWHPTLNRAAVAFYDNTNGKLWYVFIGDPMAPQAAVEIDGDVLEKTGSNCSLTFNPLTGQPSVAYQDVTNGDLYYVRRSAS